MHNPIDAIKEEVLRNSLPRHFVDTPNCKHRHSTCQIHGPVICNLATTLASTPCPIVPDHCTACTSTHLPKAVNKVIVGLAQVYGTADLTPYLHHLTYSPENGPGTELKKLIQWFLWDKAASCESCANREITMNHWGPDKCEEKMETILEWLKESADNAHLPFVPFLVRLVVKRAIRNARCGQ